MQPPSPEELPYATAKSLGILGKIRQQAGDFRVEEVPAYLPSGEGPHLLVQFEKTSLDTPVAVRRIAQALGCDPRAAGYAGLKDRHAVTTQWASFEGATAEAAHSLSLPGIRVLEAGAHGNKLRTGHLRENRFVIRIREPQGDASIAAGLLEALQIAGVPNYFGPQRFGRDGSNLTRARAWLVDGGRAPRDRFERKMLMSTLQADLFNRWLAARVAAGELGVAVEGDLLRKEDSGGLFTTDDLADATARVAAWEVSPTGPIFGAKMRSPLGEAARREEATLDAAGVTVDTFRAARKHGEGTRRVARVRPTDTALSEQEGDLLVSFSLPRGAYATVVLRELMKT